MFAVHSGGGGVSPQQHEWMDCYSKEIKKYKYI